MGCSAAHAVVFNRTQCVCIPGYLLNSTANACVVFADRRPTIELSSGVDFDSLLDFPTTIFSFDSIKKFTQSQAVFLEAPLGEQNLGSWKKEILNSNAEAPGPGYDTSTLLLAENRTKRSDILSRFHKYRGGWDIANKHYWAVELLGRLRSPYLLSLIGYCSESNLKMLVSEFMANGGLYALTGHLTAKSDVYSYEVVLLESLSGRVPVDMKRTSGLPQLTYTNKVGQIMDQALEGQYPMKKVVQVAAIAAVCVQPEADYRPLMADVVQSLVPLVKHHNGLSKAATCSSFRAAQSPKAL
ncbi:pti1-like tyrosine-protein kinase 2 [Phtheirospermum japonicum]|uniref:Pti1-like tyrosine-protein kinase 2 n=1 Tax=Phtheirospermum japonicum TaxID=374723 RepID=A0A830CB37_9LAMI|nr:pti1-like tyrosine-protein kinase 2 [Phtheirospermum japonicum]